jgi:AcrR family transcriptional regulator
VTTKTDGRLERGARSRASILDAACDLASVEGLEGLTIGRLAAETGMSKSGLFAHFGSKEELQLATNDRAGERFREAVIEPTRQLEPGRRRLDALLDSWLDYMRAQVFRGGCFFNSVRAEFDSRPDGPVRDAIVEGQRAWRRHIAKQVGVADPGADAQQLAFEIDALGTAANYEFQLLRDPRVFDRASRAMRARLG